jgi:5-methylcytosine-specific restriction endonuclease McrA
MEQSIIYVVAASGTPLMPTKNQKKVWYWLRKGLAEVVSREPLTIRLRFETTEYTQPVTLGIDTGSQTVGIAATSNSEVVYQAEMHLRDDITSKVTQRRQYRRTRRSRKTRYRPARWVNRRRPDGWLPPSVRSKCDATLKAVRRVASLLPVSQVNIELASFDTQKIQYPEISGVCYQQGELQGYLLREYLLHKWQRKCAYCQAEGIPLQIEHLVPKSRRGSDRASNLTLACEPCNRRKGNQTAEEFGYPELQAQGRVPLRDAAHVSSLKTAVLKSLQELFGPSHVRVTYGYETKYKRIQILGLPKSHHHDAIAIACGLGEMIKPLPIVYQFRCLPRGNYQLYNGKHSEHKVWAPKKVKGWMLYEIVEAKGVIGYIGGRRVKGAFVLKDLGTGKPTLEVTPRKLRRLARPVQGWIIHREEVRASSPD